MRRLRTPTTAWPAVADLMTILAVVGLSAAASVELKRPRVIELERELEQRDSRIVVLEDKIKAKDSRIVVLEGRVTKLQKRLDGIEIGFTPCWRGGQGEKRYFFTYDVTFANGRYSVSKHDDFARGTRVVDELPVGILAVLDGVPEEAVDEVALFAFGRRVMDAIGSFDRYAHDCRLAVNINREATGNEIDVINQAGFFPVYR